LGHFIQLLVKYFGEGLLHKNVASMHHTATRKQLKHALEANYLQALPGMLTALPERLRFQ
jgi:hypothetical protein